MTSRRGMAFWFAALISFAGVLFFSNLATAQPAPPKVQFQTSMGNFTLELDPQRAPKTVENFLRYVREGFYSGIIVHRVVPGFVIQAGGYDAQDNERPVHEPIALETATAAKNLRGTISMARTQAPNSARSQFFINLANNDQLDPAPGEPPNATGYTVFGHVVDGMQVIDAIAMAPLGGNLGPMPQASPRTPVVIQRATVVN